MTRVPQGWRAKKLAIQIGGDASRHVGLMLERQNLNGLTASQRDFPLGSIGCLGGDRLPKQGHIHFFTGLPINGPNVKDIVDSDAAARLLPQFDGAFAGVFWDCALQLLTVVTDCLGMQPLYMRLIGGVLTLATETKAFGGDPDPAAWGAFISIGHPIGERSLLKDVRRVPPASVLTFDCGERRMTIRRYWQIPEPSKAWRSYDFLASLENDLRGYAAFGASGTVLLSGGLDSRLLLFLLLRRARLPVDALIVAHDDEYNDADGRLAEMVATDVGIRFRKARPPGDFFSSGAYLDYLQSSDVGFPSLDLFIAKVASQINSPAVWEGLVPALAFNAPHQPEGGFGAYQRQEVRGWNNAEWHAARILFKPEIVEAMYEGFCADLREEISLQSQDMYGVLRFVVRNRSRNRTSMNPLKVFANSTNAYTPGLSKDFLAHAFSIPFEERRQARFYRHLLASLGKRVMTVPLLSGGELLKGSTVSLTYCRERFRIAYQNARVRHPHLFLDRHGQQPEYSAFLSELLFKNHDDWLNSQSREQLTSVDPSNYVVWKLLFHWKAWCWIHEGRLERLRDGTAAHASKSCCW